MKRMTTAWRVLLAAAMLASAAGIRAEIISVVPGETAAASGDVVLLDLVVSEVPLAAGIGDFDINVGFDPARLALASFAAAPFLGDFLTFEALDFSIGDLGDGRVNLSVVSLLALFEIDTLLALQPDETFALGSLAFSVFDLAHGESTTVFVDEVFALGDEFGEPVAIDGLNAATIVNPVAVAAPGTLSLLGAGFVALALFASPRRRTGKGVPGPVATPPGSRHPSTAPVNILRIAVILHHR